MKKIYINPTCPKWMDTKPLELRSESHLKKWFNRPYIRTEDFGEDDYKDYCERMAYTQEDGYLGEYTLETEEQFLDRREKGYKQWLEAWPEAVRYDVRILNGGAHDRTVWKGSYKTINEAIAACNKIMHQ